MANLNNPNGLRPINSLLGAQFSGRVGRYVALAATGTAIYVGGLVKPNGSADADGIMDVTGNVATGDIVLGVVVGIDLVTRDSLLYREASTLRYIFVADDPRTIFEVQDDAASTPAVTAVGNVADLKSFTSGSTVTGRSSIEISYASITATGDGTEDVMLMGLVQRPNNAIGANAKWAVRLTNHYFDQDRGL